MTVVMLSQTGLPLFCETFNCQNAATGSHLDSLGRMVRHCDQDNPFRVVTGVPA